MANGVPDAPAVTAATGDYVAEQDTLGNFLDECCRVGRPGHIVFNDFMPAFLRWLEAHGENPRAWSRKRLGNELKRRGFEKSRPHVGEERGKTLYAGLTLLVAPPTAFSTGSMSTR